MELNPILNLDIGGQKFRVLRETVMKYPHSLLAQVVTGKDTYHMLIADGAYFFDRNPQYFAVILDYMRIGKVFIPCNLLEEQLKEEFAFWKLDGLKQQMPSVPPNACEATLLIPDTIEATLVMPENIEATVVMNTLIEPTVLTSSPRIEPTLLIQDTPPLDLKEENRPKTENVMKNSIKNFRSFASQGEMKREAEKVNFESDELLSSLLPESKDSAPSRNLPWASKNPPPKKKEPENNRIFSAKLEENKNKIRAVAKKDKEEELVLENEGYESSFIDDDDLSLDSSENFKPEKRKNTKNQITKKLKPNSAGKCKKGNLPNIDELSNALKNKGKH